jgi:hypothetical protein
MANDDSGLSDDELQQLTQLGIIPGEQGDLQNQLKLAQALRYSEGPGMSGNWNSRVQTAPSPLAVLNSAAQNVQGGLQMGQIHQKQAQLRQQQAAGRLMMAKLLRGRNPTAAIPGSAGTTTNFEDPSGGSTTNSEGQ